MKVAPTYSPTWGDDRPSRRTGFVEGHWQTEAPLTHHSQSGHPTLSDVDNHKVVDKHQSQRLLTPWVSSSAFPISTSILHSWSEEQAQGSGKMVHHVQKGLWTAYAAEDGPAAFLQDYRGSHVPVYRNILCRAIFGQV